MFASCLQFRRDVIVVVQVSSCWRTGNCGSIQTCADWTHQVWSLEMIDGATVPASLLFCHILTPPLSHPGVPQPFLPRSLPLQQHNIMGQPYIELRHRAPENRLRLPPPSIPEPGPGLGARLGETLMDQQHVGPSAALPGADGIEEHLEDSAVKDLEDVEVKDLVDLNLNLDPEDGRNTQVTC